MKELFHMNYNNKKVSIAVVRRLPRYYRYLGDLLKHDIHRISSKELSKRMGVTASQIRQDLNCFGVSKCFSVILCVIQFGQFGCLIGNN